MYDFVVVGAGPAGSRFARRAADAGHDVLVLERGQVGTPLACSGHVSTDIWKFTPEGARDDLLQNEVYGARFHIDGPRSPEHPFYKDEVISNVIDRVGLDRTLARAAEDAGADLREGHSVSDVDEHGEYVDVTANTPDGTETFRGKMVVGCDGPVSRVRRELHLPEPGEKLQGVLGFTTDTHNGNFVDVHLTAPRFFAWRIPRGTAGVEYGLAAPPGENARELFDRFTADYGVETENFCAGMIPIGPARSVTAHRGFLIGDAAAQTKPFTGGGILYGMTAADHAVETVDPDDPATLADYERAWRGELKNEIRLGHWVRRAYSLPKPVQKVGLTAMEGEIGVHMDKPTSFFSTDHLRKLLSRSS
ncbi:geranylgeranyl hydrogenase [Haladaptatus paucihalophilus DX253]|uniref:Electron-transferring-flavoprotein dehydrogenase n=1 Tax=Haladaptatus paucihalophilus DX253 TaxID=797209 RepID=E7QU30_HALPU|nr:geranylgeranyl reductase family protein [Haladaptatus paucihalophilus]EFW92109.1 geranylgeranyl hydrogenase [Haladaptatus paucihalophilus DX253]SHK88886.1 electron-transferring-flavoprotein dehydrogenase [Haladaptatus paucihalophilus DX253]